MMTDKKKNKCREVSHVSLHVVNNDAEK